MIKVNLNGKRYRLCDVYKYFATKFAENPGKFASVVLQMYWDVKKERDSYKQQRNELINDIADIKRKAEAWDKVVEIYQAQYEEGLTHNEVVDKIGYIIHDLERT
ncbi:hypothetical protein [Staphylococcus borealis]|uniref:hypothetical protein n=1 Tax=Staphylococcus borealis TaxID=2742203 RepID=UPI002A83A1C3|nr:hypothetical protein [Staphylococcus borealis]MDY4023218.1 hypothetical protein [Staphylococcus borealis]